MEETTLRPLILFSLLMIISLLMISFGSLIYFIFFNFLGVVVNLYMFIFVCFLIFVIIMFNYANEFLIDGFNFFLDSIRINLVILRV